MPNVVTLIKGNVRQLQPATFPLPWAQTHKPNPWTNLFLSPHQFLEEVPDSLVVAPLLDAGKKSVVELPVDLIELRHFEEDRFYLGHSEHRLRRRSCRLQRLHRLRGTNNGDDRCKSLFCSLCVNCKHMYVNLKLIMEAKGSKCYVDVTALVCCLAVDCSSLSDFI